MSWLVEHADSGEYQDDAEVLDDLRDFMAQLGFEECLGLPEPVSANEQAK